MKNPLILLLLILSVKSYAQRDFSDSEITKVVLLGTGTPNPRPSESGPSIAIVINNVPYIIDFGPGLIRRASSLSASYGDKIKMEALDIKNIKRAFLTHMHSDHTVGFPDLLLTPWVLGRDEPLEVFGPTGIKVMTDHILKAYQQDIDYRLNGLQPANDQGWRVNSHEIKAEGLVYKDENVEVEAFPVPHGSWTNAWGYRFTTPDKVIVISGDTSLSNKLIEYATGADILVHEVYSQKGFESKSEEWQKYHSANHTSTYEVADVAKKAKPGLVILYHILYWGSSESDLLNEVKAKYKGKVVVGKDLDVY